MRVVLVPRDIDGSGCYRVWLPARELRLQRGWDAHMAPYVTRQDGRVRLLTYCPDEGLDTFLLREDFDVLVWQQRGEPWTQVLAARLRAQGKRVLVDSDDAWWGLPDWNPGSRRPAKEVAAMRRQLGAADGLSVATPALAELYAPYQSNIRVIRNRLDWRMWEDTVPAYEIERRRVRIGWMGDSTWRAGDLHVLRPWLREWLLQHPEVEFVAAGDPRVHDVLDIPAAQRVSTNMVEFYNFDLADITATFDIGLVPLDLSTPEARRLNECKSHLKGLEYNACGVPFVASSSESYRWYIENGGVGLVTHGDVTWPVALDAVLNGNTWLPEVQRMARRAAQQHTLQADISEWEDWIAGSSRSAHTKHPRTRTTTQGSVGVR